MNDIERRRYNMLIRVRDFGLENAVDFPSGSVGATNFTAVDESITELDQNSATQTSGVSKSQTSNKASARSELRQMLKTINVTAQSIAVDNPSIIETFRMPRGDNDQQLIAKARSFAIEAASLKGVFVEFGLTGNFINDLEIDITNFAQAITEQGNSITNRVGATANIDSAIDKGLKAVKRLNAVILNKYADKPAKLAEWTSAAHVEKAPKKKLETPPTA